jgi:cell division protein FtsA
MAAQAEKLKLKFGAALIDEVYENRIITIPGLKGHQPKEISERNLARIIQARVEEIFDYVLWEVRRSGFERKLIGGIVITGGGALLKHIDKLAAFHTGMSTRIGIPIEHLAHGYSEDLGSPIYATSVGLLMKGILDVESGKVKVIRDESTDTAENEEELQIEKTLAGGPWYEQIFKKTREWFEAEPDADF